MTNKTDIQSVLNNYLKQIHRLDELFEKNRIKKDTKTSENKVINDNKSVINKLTSLPELMQKLRNKKDME